MPQSNQQPQGQPEQQHSLYEKRADKPTISFSIAEHQKKYGEKKGKVNKKIDEVVKQLGPTIHAQKIERLRGEKNEDFQDVMNRLEAIKQNMLRIEATTARQITREDEYEGLMLKAEDVIAQLEDVVVRGNGVLTSPRFEEECRKEWTEKILEEKGIKTQNIPGTNRHTLDLPDNVLITINGQSDFVPPTEYNIPVERVNKVTGLSWEISLSRKRVIITEQADGKLPDITLDIGGKKCHMEAKKDGIDIWFSMIEDKVAVPPPATVTPEPAKPAPAKPEAPKPAPAKPEKPKPVPQQPAKPEAPKPAPAKPEKPEDKEKKEAEVKARIEKALVEHRSPELKALIDKTKPEVHINIFHNDYLNSVVTIPGSGIEAKTAFTSFQPVDWQHITAEKFREIVEAHNKNIEETIKTILEKQKEHEKPKTSTERLREGLKSIASILAEWERLDPKNTDDKAKMDRAKQVIKEALGIRDREILVGNDEPKNPAQMYIVEKGKRYQCHAVINYEDGKISDTCKAQPFLKDLTSLTLGRLMGTFIPKGWGQYMSIDKSEIDKNVVRVNCALSDGRQLLLWTLQCNEKGEYSLEPDEAAIGRVREALQRQQQQPPQRPQEQPPPHSSPETMLIPEGTERLDLSSSPEAKQWAEKMVRTARASREGGKDPEGVFDSSNWLSDELKEWLNARVVEYGADGQPKLENGRAYASLTGGGRIELARTNENGYQFCFRVIDANNKVEEWYISEARWYKDQFRSFTPNGYYDATGRLNSGCTNFLAIWKKGADGKPDKQTQYLEQIGNLMTGSGNQQTIDFSKIVSQGGMIDRARQMRAKEVGNAAWAKNFDFAGNPWGYVSMHSADTSDILGGAHKDGSEYLPRFMNSLTDEKGNPRYNFLTLAGEEVSTDNGKPVDVLTDKLTRLLDEKKVDHFYLNFGAHGGLGGIALPGGTLTPEDFRDKILLNPKFAECSFFVNTDACFTGGMAKMMESFVDTVGKMDGRIRMRFSTKNNVVGTEGRTNSTHTASNGEIVNDILSDYHMIFFTRFMKENPGMKAGEAHYLADLEAKKYVPMNSEMWVSHTNAASTHIAADAQQDTGSLS
ncbi:MAG: hypothetical protein PHI23_02915 [Candidatus Peribacteraceae bacterium]|nr:hypothetical protein [Candidatus Peribacteraceae bacterium]